MAEKSSEGKSSPKPVRTADELRRAVRRLVDEKHGAGEIRHRMIDELAEELVTDRIRLLKNALLKREEQSKKIKKIHPDNVIFDAEGKKISEAFTKQQLDQRKLAQEELDRLDRAIEQAINENDYERLSNLVNGGEYFEGTEATEDN
jgi:hypothetical protein